MALNIGTSASVSVLPMNILDWFPLGLGFPDSSVGKESACNAGDPRSVPGVRKIHWRRNRLPTPIFLGFPYGSAGKESTCNAEDLGLIPGLGRSPGEGKDYPLQYTGLENSMDRIVHGVAKSRTWLSNFWRRKWQPTLVFLPKESHGKRSLVGYSSWDHKSQTPLSTIFSFFFL